MFVTLDCVTLKYISQEGTGVNICDFGLCKPPHIQQQSTTNRRKDSQIEILKNPQKQFFWQNITSKVHIKNKRKFLQMIFVNLTHIYDKEFFQLKNKREVK